LPHRSSVSLSTYMAAMDDVTTWALVLGDEKRGRAGVSVALNAEWGPAAHHHRRRKNLPCDAVDIQATISKIGRNLGFVWAEIKDASTGELLCHGSHIKYLPMGPLMDFMQHINGRKLAIWYADNFLKYHPPVDDRPLADLFEPSFQMQSDTRATFQVGREHASLGGPIHGGCQAVLMELAATEALKRTCPTMTATLDSIHVEYLSSPGGKEVELVVELLPCSDSSPIVPVQVSLISKGRTSSTGLLRFTREVDSSALLLSKL
jgi:acyl-coenzyme A thioesterase PaaI-like protein